MKPDFKTKIQRTPFNTDYDIFNVNTRRKAHQLLLTAQSCIFTTLGIVIILTSVATGSLMLNSCGDETEIIKPSGMDVYKNLPLDKTVEATFDSLGFSEGFPIKYLDNRTGEYIELAKDEAKSTTEKWIGTESHTTIDGYPCGKYDVEMVKPANLTGLEIKHSDAGTILGEIGYEMSENVVRDGIKQTTDGNFTWLLHPPVKANNAIKEKTILAECIKNDVKTGLISSLVIIE